MLTALINSIIYTGNERLTQKAVLIENETIAEIVNLQDVPSGINVIDLQGDCLAPGLIDLQIYGAGDEIFSAKPELPTLLKMEEALLKQGCTGFYATVATNETKLIEEAINVAKKYRLQAKGSFLGLHLEGPYLNPNRKGAHSDKFIKKGSVAELKYWLELADGEIKMMTIAPELQSEEFINYLTAQKITVSVGHSDASYEQGLKYFQTLPAATHLYNAMPQMHHRTPGLIPAIFSKRPFTSIVADGIHVSFPMIKLAKQLLGDKLFLITDAVTETTRGTYHHKSAHTHYTMPDGTLSGSNLSMIEAVKNCVRNADISLDEALRMATAYPAQLINQANSIGYISPGFKANMVVFDSQFNIKQTFLNGLLC